MRQSRLALTPFLAVIFALLEFLAPQARASGDRCDICDSGFVGGTYFSKTDAVTGDKKMVCKDCMKLKTVCFLCGLPVKTNPTELPDKRVLCPRDAKTAILDDEEAKQICRQTKDAMDRLFSRFLDLPEANVAVKIVDRTQLQNLVKDPGRDQACGDVWGCTETKTNEIEMVHFISILGGLPHSALQSTCAHEYGHTWLNQNLSARRRKALNKDTTEGFCELLAYLLMDSENDEQQKQFILANTYTRGQVQLLLDAQRAYGLNDVADWMRYGVDDALSADSPQRVRNVLVNKAGSGRTFNPDPEPVAAFAYPAPAPTPAPQTLALKGVFMSNRPQAVINNRSFEVNESGNVRVGTTNVNIRCLAIGQDFARIKLLDSGEERDLHLKAAE